MTTAVADASALIRQNLAPEVRDITSRPTDLFDFLRAHGLVKPWSGGSPYEFPLTYVGNSSAELFVENQALGASGKRSIAKGSISPWYARARAGVTGHMRDLVQRGGTIEDVQSKELDDAAKAVYSQIETTLCGSAQDKGIASIIDSGDVHAGLDPATYTQFAAVENNVGGALTIAALEDSYVTVTSSGHDGDPTAYLSSQKQIRKYSDLATAASGSAAASIYRAVMPSQSGMPYDIGVMKPGVAFNGAPFIRVRSLADSEIYGLDLANGGFYVMVIRDLMVEFLGKTNDNTEATVSTGLTAVCEDRRRHVKWRGLT